MNVRRVLEDVHRLIRTFLVAGLLATCMVTAGHAQVASALTQVVMPESWTVTCDSSTNALTIDLGSASPITSGSGVTIVTALLDQNGTTTVDYQRSVVTTNQTVAGQQHVVASVNLMDLQQSSGNYPESMTTWTVALTTTLNNQTSVFFRMSALTTVVVNGSRTCPPPALIVNIVRDSDGQVQRGAQVFAVPVQLCGSTERAVELSSGVLGTNILTRGLVQPGFYWIGVAAPEGLASQWYDRALCDEATQILVKPDGTVEPPAGSQVSPGSNGVPTIQVRLKQGRVAVLKVNGPDGPVNAACVTAWTWNPGTVWGIFVGRDCGGDNGIFRVPGIAVGLPITLQIQALPGLLPTFYGSQFFTGTTGFTIDEQGQFISATNGNVLPREVTLQRSGTLVGVVQGPDGNPVKDVCVFALDSSSGSFAGNGCTDSQGRYRVDVEPNRTYRLRFDGTSIGLGVTLYKNPLWSLSTPVSVGEETIELDTVVLSAATNVSVNVRKSNTQPINNACVTAWGNPDTGYTQYVNTQCYSLSGTYQIGGLEPGKSYKLLATAPGFVPRWFDGTSDRSSATAVTAPNGTPVNIDLAAAAALTIGVRNSTGAAIAACVAAFAVTTPGQWGEYLGGGCNGSGDVFIDNLPPGTRVALGAYTVDGNAAASWVGRSGSNVIPVGLDARATFTVPESGELALGTVLLPIARSISGVATVDGSPTSGVCADAFTPSANSVLGTFIARGCSDASGAYTIRGLPDGTSVRIRFSHQSIDAIPVWYRADNSLGTSDPTLATMVALSANVSDVDVDLSKGSSLQFSVVSEGGEGNPTPVANVCVNAIDTDGRWTGGACSNSTGLAVIRGLPTGTYRLWLQSNNALYRSGFATDDDNNVVEVSTADTPPIIVTARPGVTVEGTVSLDGSLIAGACVVAKGGSPEVAYPVACTDQEGKFTLASLDGAVPYSFEVFDSEVPPRFLAAPLDSYSGGAIDILSESQSSTFDSESPTTDPPTPETEPHNPNPDSESPEDTDPQQSDEVNANEPVVQQLSVLSQQTPQGISEIDLVVLKAKTAESATVRWSTQTTGPFTVTASIGSNPVFSMDTPNKEFSVLGLVSGLTYRITVTAGGTTIGSVNVLAADDQSSPPQPPGQPSIDRIEGNSVSVSWQPVSTSEGPIRYVAYLFDASGSIVAEVSTEGTAAVFSGLKSPANYAARVAAFSTAGISPLSPPSIVANVNEGQSPSEPLSLVGTIVPDGLRITWQPPSDSGGAATIGYEIQIVPEDVQMLTQAPSTPACVTVETSCTLTNLTPNSKYRIFVEAYSNFGRSSPASIYFYYRPSNSDPGGSWTPNIDLNRQPPVLPNTR